MSPSMNSRLNVLRARLFAKPRTLVLTPEGVSVAGRAMSFADWCAQHGGEACRLVVSSRLLHDFVFEPGLPLPDAAAREAYARQQFGHYFGASSKAWALASWTGGASALQGVDLAALRADAAQAGVDLRAVEPAWAPLLRRLAAEEIEWAGAAKAALAWVEGTHLLWLELADGQLTAMRGQRLEAPTLVALQACLIERGLPRMLVAGCGLDGATLPTMMGVRQLGRLDAAEPDAALFEAPRENGTWPAPDFLGAHAQRAPLAWPLAVTGALVLATAAHSAWVQHGERDAAREALAQLQTKARPRMVAMPALISTPVTRDESLKHALEVQALLDEPWGALLAEVERAGLEGHERIDWLGLDYVASRGNLHLTGLAPQQGPALQLVDRLLTAPGWSQVVLGRFESGTQGLVGQRFELTAQIDGRQLREANKP